ncbi:phosphoribosyltransferase [Bradyrhizobium sacchari]|uniref:Adenine/guanine phosphoribosyltransferase-like PRPP-binding protein n=1 Tax=Bradyrhizobium sacchari TaxID=1399419 RepID=A0A560JNI2_9BRAD|nr:phosphoribosyltransferase [Bradyrhizobium sacchari]OPY98095.1 phosphoribosyltransferase [Bradyrhizobium sacchari]TWB58932.1 adenine/guanine phosphoribosyltransferase-like PRPP-binding protein [Bradyrhizobium sacchari]TWB72708.1 adenine/guanine phosphoribosyltransferase-like PRPP-binding protein [Bradyrhizobium sacchari]
MTAGAPYTEATIGYWQDLTPEVPARFPATAPYRFGYPVTLPCGRILVLPLRQLPDGDCAVASLIANQASHLVVAALADHMATQARAFDAEIIVGLPTLGLAFASLIAERLGQKRYVPLGYSRKFWYDDALSEPVTSITSPETGKKLRLDPNLLPLIEGRRVVLVDDAISTGTTAIAAARLLQKVGADIAGMVVAMKQTNRWQASTAALSPPLAVRAVYGCPLFQRGEAGWVPLVETQPAIP